MERADHTILFDNSAEEGFRLIAVLGRSGSQWFEPVPDWAKGKSEPAGRPKIHRSHVTSNLAADVK